MEEAVSEWLRKLGSNLAGVRSHAAWQLGRLGDASAVSALIERLRSDEDEDVRWTAAWALAELADEAAIPALEAASETDGSDEVRSRAWETLRTLRGDG